jgi:hypothetical protein
MGLSNFLKIIKTSKVEKGISIEKETILLNPIYISSIIINNYGINIICFLNGGKECNVYKIFKEVDKIPNEKLEEQIDKVYVLKCYVSNEEYEKLLEKINNI